MGFRKPLQFLQPEDFWFSAPKKGVIVIHQKKKKEKKKKEGGNGLCFARGDRSPINHSLVMLFRHETEIYLIFL
jgi:hypothetical protein